VRDGVRPFPAQPSHVLCYLGYLQEEGAVIGGSLQPYLSAINSWHADMGLSKPLVGQAVNMLCRGYGEVQGDEDDESVLTRRLIPAYVMGAILTLSHSTPSLPIRLAATASVLCYAFMLRTDSCVRLKHRHVSFTSQGLSLQLHVKTRWRDISTMVHRPGHDEVFGLWTLEELFRSNGVICRTQRVIQGDDNGHVGRPCEVSQVYDDRPFIVLTETKFRSSPPRLGAHVPCPWPSFVMDASRQNARHLHIVVHQLVVSSVL